MNEEINHRVTQSVLRDYQTTPVTLKLTVGQHYSVVKIFLLPLRE